MGVTPDLACALDHARRQTFELVAPLTQAQLEAIPDPIMSPLDWDLGHIAAHEDLWLVHRHGGEDLLRGDLAALYDAFETPRTARGDLPICAVARYVSTWWRCGIERWRSSSARARATGRCSRW